MLADAQIPIGLSSALTGEGSTYGEDIKNVVLFANEKLGRGRFKLIIEDDKCNGKDAVTAAKKLVEVDKEKGVIGYGCSGALLAAAPIFERAKVPAIGTEASAAKISQAGEYIFRTQSSDAAGVNLLYDYLQKKHKTFGALSAQTDFCQGIAQDLERLAVVDIKDDPLFFDADLTEFNFDTVTQLLIPNVEPLNGSILGSLPESTTHLKYKGAETRRGARHGCFCSKYKREDVLRSEYGFTRNLMLSLATFWMREPVIPAFFHNNKSD